MQHVYSVLRFVPDVVLGECINIGIIVGADGDEWQYIELSTLSRLRWFNEDMAEAAHRSVREIVADVTSEERLRWWHSHAYRGCVSVSQPLPIDDVSTAAAAPHLERAFSKPPQSDIPEHGEVQVIEPWHRDAVAAAIPIANEIAAKHGLTVSGVHMVAMISPEDEHDVSVSAYFDVSGYEEPERGVAPSVWEFMGELARCTRRLTETPTRAELHIMTKW